MKGIADNRCEWCQGSELYIHYHDTEWGRPCHDSQQLFEMLNLEGAQAGLSWITILNKREGYRRNFSGFDPVEIVQFSDVKLDELSQDPAIVRHRQKVYAVRTNARALLELKSQGIEFSDFIWRYVDFNPVDNRVQDIADVPSSTPVSAQMSKDLKRLGFSFVGPTTCYAFMQAAGLVNDHLVTCPCYDGEIA